MEERKVVIGLKSKGVPEEMIEGVEHFTPVHERYFETRQVEITVTGQEMIVSVPGKEEPVEGYLLVSENLNNPNPLEVIVEKGELFQDPADSETFYLKEGMVSISGEKRFESLERFKASKGTLERLPAVRDPDLTRIDGLEFRQTGTIQVKVKGAIIRLGE